MPAPTTVVVGSRLNDHRTAVSLVVTFGTAPVARVSAPGTVTSVFVSAGASVGAGTPLIAVNDVPVLAFVGASPLFRDMSRYDEGADVKRLGTYMASLGFMSPDDVSDYYGSSLEDAVVAFQDHLGVDPDGTFRLSYVAYIPAGSFHVASVAVRPGDTVTSVTTVVEGERPVEAVQIAPISEGVVLSAFEGRALSLLVGSDVLDLPGLDLDSSSRQSVVEALRDAVASGAATNDQIDDSTERFSGGVLALSEGSPVGVVPSTAVFLAASGNHCVFSVTTDDGRASTFEARKAGDVAISLGEVGEVSVDSALVGVSVLRDATAAPEDVQSTC